MGCRHVAGAGDRGHPAALELGLADGSDRHHHHGQPRRGLTVGTADGRHRGDGHGGVGPNSRIAADSGIDAKAASTPGGTEGAAHKAGLIMNAETKLTKLN